MKVTFFVKIRGRESSAKLLNNGLKQVLEKGGKPSKIRQQVKKKNGVKIKNIRGIK